MSPDLASSSDLAARASPGRAARRLITIIWIDPPIRAARDQRRHRGFQGSRDGGNKWWLQTASVAVLPREGRRRRSVFPRLRQACRTTAPGRRQRVPRMASPTALGEQAYGEAYGFWMFEDPADTALPYQGGLIAKTTGNTQTRCGASSRWPATAAAGTGTRRTRWSSDEKRARSTSARSSCSVRATTADRPHLARIFSTNRPGRSRSRGISAARQPTTRRRRCTSTI